jgi:hypothetical protein
MAEWAGARWRYPAAFAAVVIFASARLPQPVLLVAPVRRSPAAEATAPRTTGVGSAPLTRVASTNTGAVPLPDAPRVAPPRVAAPTHPLSGPLMLFPLFAALVAARAIYSIVPRPQRHTACSDLVLFAASGDSEDPGRDSPPAPAPRRRAPQPKPSVDSGQSFGRFFAPAFVLVWAVGYLALAATETLGPGLGDSGGFLAAAFAALLLLGLVAAAVWESFRPDDR